MKLNTQKYLFILLGSFPILFFIYYVWQFTINVPFLDDTLYYTKCLVDVNKSNSISEAFWLFMKQHTITEHRTPISKFIAWLIYKTTGTFNYTILAHLGNLALFGMLWLFWRFFKKHSWHIAYFLPIPFLIFQMQTYENQFWTICNWTYYPIGLLQMVVLYLLSYRKANNLLYAIVVAILATFTFSNGMFVFLPAGLILIYQKRYKDLVYLTLVGVACVALYFSNFKPSPIAQHQQLSIGKVLSGFLLMLGSYIDVQSYHQIARISCTAVGLLILGYLLFGCVQLLKKYVNSTDESPTLTADYLFLCSSIACLCMSAGAVAYSRYSGLNGFEEMFVSRYRFISVTILCLVYLFSLLLNKVIFRKVVLLLFLPLTIFLYAYSYYFVHEYNINFRERLVAATFNFKFHDSWVLYPFDNDWTSQVDIANEEAIKTGVYQLPTLYFTQFQDKINAEIVSNKHHLPLKIEQRKDRFIIVNETLSVENPLSVGLNIVLKSNKNTYLLPLRRQRNRGRKDMLFHGNYFWKGFETDILKNTFLPDDYTIGLLRIENGKYNIEYSDLKIRL